MPRRRPGSLFPLEQSILENGTTLQARDGSFYGFSLARSLSDEGGALTGHGTLYKALARMTEAGLLESSWEDPAAAEHEGRPRRRLYTVSAAGRQALATATAAASTVSAETSFA